MEKEDLHILRLMGEIDRTGDLSQRELSRRLNLSLGLVNTFMKRLVSKGYFKMSTMPKNRVKYFLTPAGLARKSRLTVEYLKYSIDSYKNIKHHLLNTYREMEKNHIQSILFYGAGEVAELAYLYLQLTGIQLAGVIDENVKGKPFFQFEIAGMEAVQTIHWDMILLTRLEQTEQDLQDLLKQGINRQSVVVL
jgi:DNA-binding MarR family transcriptional regulator